MPICYIDMKTQKHDVQSWQKNLPTRSAYIHNACKQVRDVKSCMRRRDLGPALALTIRDLHFHSLYISSLVSDIQT